MTSAPEYAIDTAGAAAQPVVLGRVSYRAMRSPGADYRPKVLPQLALTLEHKESQWFVVEEMTGIFGVGTSPQAALTDGMSALREHLDVLERSAPLSAGLQEQLEYLRARLRRT